MPTALPCCMAPTLLHGTLLHGTLLHGTHLHQPTCHIYPFHAMSLSVTISRPIPLYATTSCSLSQDRSHSPHTHMPDPSPQALTAPKPCHPHKDSGAGYEDMLSPATSQSLSLPRLLFLTVSVARATHLALFTVKEELRGHQAGDKPRSGAGSTEGSVGSRQGHGVPRLSLHSGE